MNARLCEQRPQIEHLRSAELQERRNEDGVEVVDLGPSEEDVQRGAGQPRVDRVESGHNFDYNARLHRPSPAPERGLRYARRNARCGALASPSVTIRDRCLCSDIMCPQFVAAYQQTIGTAYVMDDQVIGYRCRSGQKFPIPMGVNEFGCIPTK